MNPDPITVETDISELATVASERRSSSWDIRNAPRNYISLVALQAGSAFFSFAAVWVITHYLGSEGYGGVIAIIAASQVAQVVIGWTAIAVVRFGVDEFIETEKIARAFWVRSIVLTVNLALVLATSGLWFPPLAVWLKLPPGARWMVLFHLGAIAFWVHVQYGLQAVKMPLVQGFLLLVERILIFVGLLGLLAVNSMTGQNAVWCYIAIPMLMIVVGMFRLRHFIWARFDVGTEFIKTIVLYSLPLAPMAAVGYFSGSYLDAIFVSDMLSTRDLGIYSVATQMNGILTQLPTLANSLLIPLFITINKEGGTGRINRFFVDVLPSATLVWAIVCLGVGFAGNMAIPAVFGTEFTGAVVPLWILLVSSSISVPILIGYSALSHAISATYVSMYAAIVAGISNVVFDLILIPRFGLIGCALATVISILMSVFTFIVLLRYAAKTAIPLSWLPISFLPTAIGVVIVTVTNSAVGGLVIGLTVAVILALSFSGSIRRSYDFARNISG